MACWCEVSGVLGVLVEFGSSNFQRSAVDTCNHLPFNAVVKELRRSVDSVRARAGEVSGVICRRFRWESWRAGIGSFFVGT